MITAEGGWAAAAAAAAACRLERAEERREWGGEDVEPERKRGRGGTFFARIGEGRRQAEEGEGRV